VLKATLSSLIALRRPVLIEGSPGLGKTRIPQDLAKDMGLEFIQFHAPTLQPEDIALPATNADRTKIDFLVNGRFPVEGSEHADEGLIVIDELPQGDNSIQKTMANLIQEREIHGRRLKPGWAVVATGNKQSDRAGANRILSHLSNRVTRLELEPHLDDWCNWALSNDVRPEVVAFLRFKSELLMSFDPNADSNPTPRAWTEGVSPVLDKVPGDAEFDCIKGAVGEGAAAEFIGFMKIARSLPNPDVILLHPDTHEVPHEPNVLYALSGALAHRASENSIERVVTYAKRMPPEFMVLVMRDAVHKCPAITSTRAFMDWAVKEGSKVLL
jgi:hypothetical protein